ncbi:MAG: hypothetical protein HY287_16235 [Planctomycetes bacterium]|nr:hypothetical protein [Planctomycetota bacterium]MBI3835875.1 hypothetical protein [Planctomycetota bacterium]
MGHETPAHFRFSGVSDMGAIIEPQASKSSREGHTARDHPIALFFATLCVIYAIWLAWWPWLGPAYRNVFSTLGVSVVGSVGESGHVRFTAPEKIGHESDVLLVLENAKKPGSQGRLPISSRTIGYLPTGFTLALIIATPTAWHRRLWSLFWGLVLISLFVGLNLWLQVADHFSGPASDPFFAYHPGPFWRATLTIMLKVLSKSPVTTYIAPVFIWLIVSFRREDVGRLLGRPAR